MPVHRRGAKNTEETQREERNGVGEKERRKEIEVEMRTHSSSLYYSLRWLCDLCAYAVNAVLLPEFLG
jgi:hypothetical protein